MATLAVTVWPMEKGFLPETVAVLALQSSLVLLLAFGWNWCLRRPKAGERWAGVWPGSWNCSAALRHQIWCLHLGFLLVLPLLLLGASLADARLALPFTLPLPEGIPVTRIVVYGQASQAVWGQWWAWAMRQASSLGAALVSAYLLGLLFCLARLATGHWAAGRLLREAMPWRGHEREQVETTGAKLAGVWLHPRVTVPMVLGLFRPRILFPPQAVDWPAELFQSALCHEQAHVARHDLFWQLLAEVVRALYWPNPFVWLAVRAQQQECELACDEAVLAGGLPPSQYAAHLMEIAKAVSTAQPLEGGLTMAKWNQLEGRLRAILNVTANSAQAGRGRPFGIRPVWALVAAGLLLLPLPGFRLAGQSQAVGMAGVIEDASGARVPDAVVTLLFPDDSTRREVTRSNDTGQFQFPALPTGNYGLRIERPGFARLEQSAIAVEAGKTAQFRFVLNMGSLRETVQVRAERLAGAIPAKAGTTAAPPTAAPPTRLRVGGNVQAANLIHKVAPIYPTDCKQEGVQGTVVLNAVVGKDGSIISLEPGNQFVDDRLRQAARSAVLQWRYKPTLLNGNPVEVATQIDVNFTLLP